MTNVHFQQHNSTKKMQFRDVLQEMHGKKFRGQSKENSSNLRPTEVNLMLAWPDYANRAVRSSSLTCCCLAARWHLSKREGEVRNGQLMLAPAWEETRFICSGEKSAKVGWDYRVHRENGKVNPLSHKFSWKTERLVPTGHNFWFNYRTQTGENNSVPGFL